MEAHVSRWGKRYIHWLFAGPLKQYFVPLAGHGSSKTLPRPLLSPSLALFRQEGTLAHQAGSDVILELLPDSPTQRPEVRAVKAQARNNIR